MTIFDLNFKPLLKALFVVDAAADAKCEYLRRLFLSILVILALEERHLTDFAQVRLLLFGLFDFALL